MARPKPPKSYKRDGDDLNTRTRYIGPEFNVGDGLKVILLQIYDMVELDNLQVAEIKALVNNLIDEHVDESEEE